MGKTGVYSHTFVYERKDGCAVCGDAVRTMTVSKTFTLNQLLQSLKTEFQLSSPSAFTTTTALYMPKPPPLEKGTRPNLDKAVHSLVSEGQDISVTDPNIQGVSLTVSLTFE